MDALDPIEVLRMGVAAAIPLSSSTGRPEACGSVDWKEVERLGRASKLLVQAARGFRRLEWATPPDFTKAVSDYRKLIFPINSLNLAGTSRIAEAFNRQQIRFLLFKGPIGQNRNYGDYFVRPSSDIDILVSRNDIALCSKVLTDIGYYLPAECDRLWWTSFLGEQHFFSARGPRATVDLHHRLQQPGCPHPRNVADYIGEPDWHRAGEQNIPYISRINAALLASMSFVKSVVQHCHSAAYLADFCALTLAFDEDERAALLGRARRQNIENTLRFTSACAASVYGMDHVSAHSAPLSMIDELFGSQLLPAIFAPERADIRWPRLRKLLWFLCDDHMVGHRAVTYSKVGSTFLVSKVARRIGVAA